MLSSLVGDPAPQRHNHDAPLTGYSSWPDFSSPKPRCGCELESRPPCSSVSIPSVCLLVCSVHRPAGVCSVLPVLLRHAAPVCSERILTFHPPHQKKTRLSGEELNTTASLSVSSSHVSLLHIRPGRSPKHPD